MNAEIETFGATRFRAVHTVHRKCQSVLSRALLTSERNMSAYSMTWLHSEYEPKERLSAVDVTRRGTTEWKCKAVFHAFDDERV